MTIISRIMILLFPLVVTIFNAYTGVALNLNYPKFDWVNETDAVKQGVAPFLAMFIAMATVALPVLLYAFCSAIWYRQKSISASFSKRLQQLQPFYIVTW